MNAVDPEMRRQGRGQELFLRKRNYTTYRDTERQLQDSLQFLFVYGALPPSPTSL